MDTVIKGVVAVWFVGGIGYLGWGIFEKIREEPLASLFVLALFGGLGAWGWIDGDRIMQGGKAAGSSKDRWLANLRKPKEVKETLAALEKIRGQFDTSDVFREGAITAAFASVRNTIESDPNRAVHSIAHDGWKPADLALLLLSKVASQGASSGRYHRYRGTLSPEGHGYVAVFRTAVNAMAASGFITPAEAEEDIATLLKQVNEAG
jgi:hypothetical protein